jgi:hypothetical protein
MASACQKTMRVRERKLRRRGQDRKNALENHGTTPSVEALFKVQPKKG